MEKASCPGIIYYDGLTQFRVVGTNDEAKELFYIYVYTSDSLRPCLMPWSFFLGCHRFIPISDVFVQLL